MNFLQRTFHQGKADLSGKEQSMSVRTRKRRRSTGGRRLRSRGIVQGGSRSLECGTGRARRARKTLIKRQTTKKYDSRPSPPFKARAYKGRRKRGNDGNWWKSTSNSNGVYTWKHV
jgi:hypothetical protein